MSADIIELTASLVMYLNDESLSKYLHLLKIAEKGTDNNADLNAIHRSIKSVEASLD